MNSKDILVSAGALMVIAGVVTAALAGTNALTEGVIARRAEETENAARRQVVGACVPAMEYTTQPAIFTAWSPMRSKYLETINRSTHTAPESGCLVRIPTSSSRTLLKSSSTTSS